MTGHMGVPGTVPRTVSWDRNEGTHGVPRTVLRINVIG